MITNSKLQVIPATSDNANLFLSLQPNSAGLTNTILSATALTYNPFSRTLSLNGIRWPASDGTAGQFLRTDGAGNLTFSAAGLQNFTDTLTLTGVNASVPVAALTATMAGPANIDFVIAPKGQGNILAQIPDGTVAGGNKRGGYSVDLQMQRTAATQVASGNNGVVLGTNNSATTIYCTAIGYGNTAQGSYSTAMGYQSTANNTGSIAFGSGNTAGGANFSSAWGGDTNEALGNFATTIGGVRNSANADSSIVVGGRYGSARGIHGNHIMPAHASPIASVVGVQQSGLLMLGRITTDATPAILTSNSTTTASATNMLVIPSNSAYYVRGSIIATVTNGGATKAWTFESVIKRALTAVTTSIVGTNIINITAADTGASTWIIALTADTTIGGLAITVTGQIANTIRWSCKIETNEVTF